MKEIRNTILLVATIVLPALVHATFIDLVFGICNSTTQYTCKDHSCIDRENLCDEQPHCPDGSDEILSVCEFIKCWPPKYFSCHDGGCIHANSSLCDGHRDCSDGSDEDHCISGIPHEILGTPAPCRTNEFQCSDGICIPKRWMCDGQTDCVNDETDGCIVKESCEDNEFMCRKKKVCVPKAYRCDGYVDCEDGTDELHCEEDRKSIDLSQCTHKNGKYACRDNLSCINISMVCDGAADCYDKSDEDSFCQILEPDKCENCTSRCVDTPSGGICLCDHGYILGEHNKCVDVNECERYGICDQKCINTPGSYHCACDPNYVLQIDGRTCFIKDGEGTLVYSVKDAIKGLTLKTRIQSTFFESIPSSVGISTAGDDLYWTSIQNGSQSIIKATQFKDRETIVTNGLGFPEDVKVDWMTRNIYFSDYKYKRIVACSNDGSVCAVLHNTAVDKPRSLCLIPERGLMFWTDWGKKAYIGRSGMDGSNAMEFVSGDELKWPNGLAIDLPNERLYWLDAKMERVETIKLDQTDRRIILSESIHHPFSIAVFENKLYWSDLKDKEIHSCNKFTGKERQSITREFYEIIHGITIRHPLLEQTMIENPCRGSPCSDLCLLAPDSRGLHFSCACPSNKRLSPDSSGCVEIHQNPVVAAAERNRILIVEYRAIGHSVITSHNFSEELYITALAYNEREEAVLFADLPTRSIYSWSLHSETAIRLISRGLGPIRSMEYDEYGNNLYFCDEDSLAVEVISLTTFARSIILSGSPSEFPSSLTLAPEHGYMFVAYARVGVEVHIDKISMDGNEVSRKRFVDVNQRGSEVKLHFSEELGKLFWVDVDTGEIECVDTNGNGRVKLFEKESPRGFTSTGSILFWTNLKSPILNSHNFYTDEYSKNVKLDLTPGSVKEFLLTAIDKLKIDTGCRDNNGDCSHLCLASYDKGLRKVCACPLGYSISADDRTCLKPKACTSDQFQCFTGECLPSSVVCDSKKDCIHGEDEDLVHCAGPRCPPEQFLCFDQSRCLDRKLKCDGKFDCDDKSDEVCNVNCTKNQFACDSGECIDLHFRCDGKVDCRGAHDELHCTARSCDENEFQCASGQCVPKEWECDREPDCGDGSDEWDGCEQKVCFEQEFRCNNQKCIDMSLTCNGFNDCGDDSDEFKCTGGPHLVHKLCTSKEFFCLSNERHCIPISARCNGTKECVRGEDEEYCANSNPCIPGREFFCTRESVCIPMEWVCDGNDDCEDGSDETKTACFQKPKKNEPCSGFKCNSGECIALSQVCDSIGHCPDKSDEDGKCYIKCEEGGCSQKCFQTPNGPVCKCKHGYELSSDNKTCIDINECDKDICAQRCINTAGGFSCGCFTPGYRLRADRVSCKALGQPSVYVVSSRNTLFMTSNNMKHTSEIPLGKHLFNTIIRLEVDGLHNYVYVLLENNIVERVSVASGEKKQLIAPKITDFTVDWITESVYTIHDYTRINVTNFNLVDEKENNRNIQLHHVEEHHYISTMSVDPVAGYIFWFEAGLDLRGSIRRADCTGANIKTLVSSLTYPVRQLVVDSFHRHLYWFDPDSKKIRRVNYNGSGNETVFDAEDDVVTFTLFESSIYLVSPNVLTVQKCRIYGLPPKKCEMIKINMHKIHHFNILQSHHQRTVPNPCHERFCSEYGMCLMSPKGPQCVCPDGKIQHDGIYCSKDGSFSSFARHSNDQTFGKYFSYFVFLCLIAGLVWITFSHCSKRKGKILHRLHFRNPVYEVPSKGNAREALLNAEEDSYDTPISEGPKSIVYDNETSTSLPTIEESTLTESMSDYRPTSRELLFVNTV